MKTWFAAVALSMPILAIASDMPEAPFRTPPDGRFAVSANPYYQPIDRPIKNRIAYFGEDNRSNHFCVVGYQWKDGNTQVWLHWLEDGSLVQWDGSLNPAIRDASLMDKTDRVEWGRDTFESGSIENAGERAMSAIAWRQLADDCDRHGEKFVFPPAEPEHK